MFWGKMKKLMGDTKVKVTEIVERLKVFVEYKLIGFVQNKWIGSIKCSKHDCNYFICTNCSNCLCDSSRYVNWSRTTAPRMREWEPKETLSYFTVVKEFIKARKLDTQIFNE